MGVTDCSQPGAAAPWNPALDHKGSVGDLSDVTHQKLGSAAAGSKRKSPPPKRRMTGLSAAGSERKNWGKKENDSTRVRTADLQHVRLT